MSLYSQGEEEMESEHKERLERENEVEPVACSDDSGVRQALLRFKQRPPLYLRPIFTAPWGPSRPSS